VVWSILCYGNTICMLHYHRQVSFNNTKYQLINIACESCESDIHIMYYLHYIKPNSKIHTFLACHRNNYKLKSVQVCEMKAGFIIYVFSIWILKTKLLKSKPNYFPMLHGELSAKKCEYTPPPAADLPGYLLSVSVES
jgi:hypothetical protein